jgi:predicted flap endonuclease-1-like 5' DNA nuclease
LNGFTLLVLLVLVAGIPLAYRAGMLRERRDVRARAAGPLARPAARNGDTQPGAAAGDAALAAGNSAPTPGDPAPGDILVAERARIIRAGEHEAHALRVARAGDAAELVQLREFAEDRRRLIAELADARGETARYREIVVDLEDNAPPPLLELAGAPDDLKLIVGVGPVLERMLHRMGIGSFRQIARWSEHDIDAVDAKLPEFHGRIRRDGWVTQARALHQSKYGERA